MKPLLFSLFTVSTLLCCRGQLSCQQETVPLRDHPFTLDLAYDYALQKDHFFCPINDDITDNSKISHSSLSLDLPRGYVFYRQAAPTSQTEQPFVTHDTCLSLPSSEQINAIILNDTITEGVPINFTNTASSNMLCVFNANATIPIS